MPILKQRTISVGDDSQTVVLKQLQNTMDRGGQYMYRIDDADTGQRIEDPFTNKRQAEQAFEQTVEDIRRGMGSRIKSRSAPGENAIDTIIGTNKRGTKDDESGNPFLPF